MKTKMKGLFLSALMVLSIFAMAAVPVSAGPGTTSATEESSTNPDPTASGTITTQGGEISNVTLVADSFTERWAGFYGNVTGTISLGSAEAGTADLYKWDWTVADEGEVIASTSNSITWADLVNGAAAEVDAANAWNFDSGSDKAADTFVDDTGSFTIGDATAAAAPLALTEGGYNTGIIKDATTVTGKGDLLFVVSINTGGTTFNGETHDFEMIVPTGATENYYFYVELS